MPTTETPCDAKSLWSLLKLGISWIHGTHHVAQKFTTTTLFENPELSAAPPSSFEYCGNALGADGAAAFTGPGAGDFCRNARYSAESLVRPGKLATVLSSGSTIA